MHFAIRLGARTKFHRRLGHCALIAIWKISLRFLELDVGRDMLTLGVDSPVLADSLLRFGGGTALLRALHGSDGREQNRALMYFGHGRPFEFLNAVLTNAVHAVFEPLVEVEAHLLQRQGAFTILHANNNRRMGDGINRASPYLIIWPGDLQCRQNFKMEQFQHALQQYFIMASYSGIGARMQPKMVYPEDIELVVQATSTAGAIYVGNLEASQNLLTLKKFGIKSVLTAASGACLSHPKSEVPFYKYIPGEDHERFDISQYFEECIKFIEDSLKETNILVHCMAGISRSVTLVIAYLIKCRGMTYEAAYASVKARRKIIHPNDGFIDQLKQYERTMKRETRYESPFRKNSESPIKRFGEYESPTRRGVDYESPSRRGIDYESPSKRAHENLFINPELSSVGSGRIASPSKVYASPTRNHYESPLKRYESPLKHSQAYDRVGGLLQSSNSRLLKDYNEVRATDLLTNKTYMNGLSPASKQIQHNHSHSLSNNHYRKPQLQNRRQPESDLDQKIADIRKKYSEYNQNIKARLSQDEGVGYRPSGPALRHMKSMNYEQGQQPHTSEYPSTFLKSQIDNYMQEPPRLGLRKQATMYQRPAYNNYEPY